MQTNKFKQYDFRFQQYIQNLKKQGLIVHKSLKPAIFTLNNGLEYPGLCVQSQIHGQQNLVLVPVKLLLTAHKALQQPQLKQVFQDNFYHEGPVWQDRILISYLLYLYWQQDKNNIWCQMVNLFTKQIDILSFWQDKQLDLFQDESVKKGALLQRQNFSKEWQKFEQIKQDYQFFKGKQQIYSQQNYRWIYIHTISRCFGSFMNSTYFTPFCQLFNHHCVGVSYNCVTKQQFQKEMKEKQQKQIKQLEQSKQSKQLKQKQERQEIQEKQKIQQQERQEKQKTLQKLKPSQSIQNKSEQKLIQKSFMNENMSMKIKDQDQTSSISSISSGNSIDFIQYGDFNYWEIQSYKIKWGGKISFDLKDKQTKQIEKLSQICCQYLQSKIVWNGWNFAFIGQVIEKINIAKNQYLAGRKKFITTKEEYQKIKSIIQNFRLQALNFHRLMGSKYDPRIETQQNINNLSNLSSHSCSQGTNQNLGSSYVKTTSPPTKDYQYFRMQARSAASFQPKDQIYFSYGHISNRSMLIRYGCCIEDNKYEHVWVKLDLNKILSPYPDLFDQIQAKGLPIKYKVKLKPHTWCYQLYLWLKCKKWQLIRHSTSQLFFPNSIQQQLQIFDNIRQLLQSTQTQFLKSYSNNLSLDDKQIGYHQYFIRVYHLQKIKIIKKHVLIAQYLRQRLLEMKNRRKIIKQKDLIQRKFQKQLKGYWKILQKGIKLF